MTLFLSACFLKKAGCLIFKQQGARFLRMVGTDWLGDCGGKYSWKIKCCRPTVKKCAQHPHHHPHFSLCYSRYVRFWKHSSNLSTIHPAFLPIIPSFLSFLNHPNSTNFTNNKNLITFDRLLLIRGVIPIFPGHTAFDKDISSRVASIKVLNMSLAAVFTSRRVSSVCVWGWMSDFLHRGWGSGPDRFVFHTNPDQKYFSTDLDPKYLFLTVRNK